MRLKEELSASEIALKNARQTIVNLQSVNSENAISLEELRIAQVCPFLIRSATHLPKSLAY